jgi:hypothetical protein
MVAGEVGFVMRRSGFLCRVRTFEI